MALRFANTGTKTFQTDDGVDTLTLKAEPTGSQYDERQGMLGNLKLPGNVLEGNTNMEELFASGEMVELSVQKQKLAEFQFRTLFVGMTIGGRPITNTSDAVGVYRKLDRESKEVVDGWVDSVWKAHEENLKAVEETKGESEASQSPSLSVAQSPSDDCDATQN